MSIAKSIVAKVLEANGEAALNSDGSSVMNQLAELLERRLS
ncbi:MAG: hypothetical protein ACKVWR_09080 [Acidimicrobiales bacterium]